MKKYRYTRVLLMMTLMAVSLISCMKTEDLLRGTSINVDTELLTNPLNIQIVADVYEQEIPSDLEIEVLGPDAEKVYTVFGEKDLVANINQEDPGVAMLPIGIRRIEQVSSLDPIVFTIVLRAEGYKPIMRNYRITSFEGKMALIRLSRENNQHEGVETKEALFSSMQDGTEDVVRFATDRNAKGEQISVEVLEGTQMFTANGEQLEGEVEAAIAHYDFSVSGVNEMAPASLFSNNAIDKDGNSLGVSAFDPIAMYTLDMYTNEREIRSFSKPLEVTVQVEPSAINPETGATIKAGDVIPVWSYNEKLGEWQEETTANITDGPSGQLLATFQQEHLSIWLLGGRFPCRDQSVVNVRNDFQERNGPEEYYYVVVYRESDNSVLWTDYTRFYNFESIELFAGFTVPVYFRIFDGPSESCNPTPSVLFESPVFNSCGEVITVDVTDALNGDIDGRANIFVDVAGTCSSSFNDLVIRPSLPILYRESGCDTWQPLGWLRNGEGETQALDVGKFYDFRISHRTLDRCIFNLQVPTQDTTVIIDSPVYNFTESVEVTYGPDNTIMFNYTDIQVPDLACDEYIDYLNNIQ
jgi:hypothetical protein